MSDPPESPRRSNVTTTPADFPVQTPPQQFPGADYSYTAELIGEIQHSLGKLTEAVETLKTKADAHGKELAEIGRSVHTARVILGIIGGLATIIATFVAIALKAYLDHIWHAAVK
jgi:hypothetical protein